MKMKLPINYLIQARDAVLNAARGYSDIDAERAGYPLTYDDALRLQGVKGAQAWLDRKQRFEDAEHKITIQTQAKIKEARQNYIDAVNAQVLPDGKDLQSADYALLRDGVVDNPQALQGLVTRNDNYAFIAAAAKYADAHGWTGFENRLDATASTFLDYGNSYLDACNLAAESPVSSYHGMLIADSNEMGRRADAYGILSAYNDAGGAGE